MFEYDEFTLGNAAITSVNSAFGYNATGTLSAPARYRMKLKQWTVAASAAGTLTVSKTNGTTTVPVFGPVTVTAGQEILAQQTPEITVESGYYLYATVSAGQASILGTGEFVPE